MVHVPLMFLSEWCENLMTARVSMLLKSRASPDMLPFSLCNKQKKKTCNSAHEQTHLSNDTVDSILRHREVGRAKDLSASPHNMELMSHYFVSLSGIEERDFFVAKSMTS